MGYEARCRARVTDASGAVREGEGAVLLEADELIVRGDARVRVPRASITGASAADGRLTIAHAGGSVALALGDAAEQWLARLQAPPKSRLDKLDVKSGARVWLSGIAEPSFGSELAARTPHVFTGAMPDAPCDVVFVQTDRAEDLARIAAVLPALGPSGALWVVHPKGRAGVLDTDVFAAAKAAGLTYTKVVRFSDTHTAEKLVRPRGAR